MSIAPSDPLGLGFFFAEGGEDPVLDAIAADKGSAKLKTGSILTGPPAGEKPVMEATAAPIKISLSSCQTKNFKN